MSPSNKVIVEKTQKILEEYGYKVKTGHLYELFSKLANEKSYNIAKAKNISFASHLSLDSEEDVVINEKVSNLAEVLRKQIIDGLKEGKAEFIVTEEMFLALRNQDQISNFKSVLAELEILGYALDPKPEENSLKIVNKSLSVGALKSLRQRLSKKLPQEKGKDNFLNSYKEGLRKNKFRNLMVYGLKDDGDFYVVNPSDLPGSLFLGGMGAGKSFSMRFTAATHMLNNSSDSFYFFVDCLKGMTDFVDLFQDLKGNIRPNATLVKDKAQLDRMVSFLFDEVSGRKEIMAQSNAHNVFEYNGQRERQSQPKLAIINVFIEEFHYLPRLINFEQECDIPGTTAYKFRTLMRVARSYGIFFHGASQRATASEFPSSLIPGLSNIFAFKANNSADVFPTLSHVQEILIQERGRCAYEEGFLQFPLLSSKDIQSLMAEFASPFVAEFSSVESIGELKHYLG